MTMPDRTETRRSADYAAKAAADLPDDAGDRALALLVACLLTPYGYGDPVLVAEWILGDKPPIDKHLDNLKGEFLADTETPPGNTPEDEIAEWHAAAMGWKTRADGAEAAIERVNVVIDRMRPLKWAETLRDAIKGDRS